MTVIVLADFATTPLSNHDVPAHRLECSSFLGSILQSLSQKLGHNQKGTTLEPLGGYLNSWCCKGGGIAHQISVDVAVAGCDCTGRPDSLVLFMGDSSTDALLGPS